MQREHNSGEDFREVLLETYAANNQMNQHLLACLDPRGWRLHPPGAPKKSGRTIAAIFAHIHNNRLVWLRRSAPHLRCPAKLDPYRSTIPQTARAHGSSAKRCMEMLRDAWNEEPNRRVTRFSRGSWSREWPAGVTMFAYMFAHEAHHRGQVLLLARQVGYGLPEGIANGIWQWDAIWKRLGFASGPR